MRRNDRIIIKVLRFSMGELDGYQLPIANDARHVNRRHTKALTL
jgi:hypothetical protein